MSTVIIITRPRKPPQTGTQTITVTIEGADVGDSVPVILDAASAKAAYEGPYEIGGVG